MNTKVLWETVLAELELTISQAEFVTFFKDQTQIEKKEGSMVTIACPSLQTKERIDTRHYQKVKKILDRLTNENCELTFVISGRKSSAIKPLGPLFFEPESPLANLEERRREAGLSSHYTFQTFIVGTNNNLAHAVAMAIAKSPGQTYNPLFLYSGVGLGKTHLLQAIGNQILENFPKLKVIYCTSEAFMNELLESIQEARERRGSTSKFRSKFRKADVLLIDDVQFLAGREQTQEEFFHTFNALYQQQKQICLTSDRPPKELSRLEERLTSRFASGMIADLQPPSTEMRVALLRNKRDQMKVNIPDQVIEFVAQSITSNIRELEGAFLQVVTQAQASGENITVDLAAKALGKVQNEKPQTTVREILKVVAEHFAISQNDLKGERRLKEIVFPRQIAMYFIRNFTGSSLEGTGEVLGGRDHSTILHGVDKIKDQIASDKKVQQEVLQIKQALGLPLNL